MDLFGKKKKAAQKAQDEKRAASDRPKSMPPRPPSKPEDKIAKARDTAKLLKQKMDQSKGQQDPRKVEGDKYPRPPMSIKEKQGLDPKQRTNLPPDRPKSLPPLKSPTSREAGKYPPSPSPQEKGMDYGRPPGASPMYPQEPQGQIKKARKDHFWDGHKKPIGGPTGYQPFNPSQQISSQYPRPSDPDEGGSMAKKPPRPKGPNSPGGAFPSNYELALRKQGIGEPQVSDKYGAGK